MPDRMDRRFLLRAIPLALAIPAAARAQTLQDLQASRKALIGVWEKTPLTIQRALFVTEKAAGYGVYDARNSIVFKPGEPMIAYVEPVGYGWKEVSPGLYEFGFDVDFAIKSKDGNTVLGEKKDFGHLVFRSHARNLECQTSLTLTVNGAPPADYLLIYTLRDVTGPRMAQFTMPFTIAA